MPTHSTRKFIKNPYKQNRLHYIVNRLFTSRLQEIPFIVFLSFLLTFVITRIYVYNTNHDILELPFLISYVSIHGVHIHHLNFGIIILVITGFLGLYDIRPKTHRTLAIFYGIGLGLTFDEFALWLRLKDDYNARITYDAIITISIVLLNIIYFPTFWQKMGGKVLGSINYLMYTLQVLNNQAEAKSQKLQHHLRKHLSKHKAND